MSNTREEEIDDLIRQLGYLGDSSVITVSKSNFNANKYYAGKRKRERIEKAHELKVKAVRSRVAKSKAKLQRRDGVAESGHASNMGPLDIGQGVQMNSREITSLGHRPGYTGEHDMSDATIKETPWDLERMVERPTLVTSFQWDATVTTVNPTIFTASVPSEVLGVEIAKIPFRSFLYWKGDVVLRLQVAGSPLIQGILAMTFVPLVNKDELDTITKDLCSMTINPTVYLFANTNTHAELRIPYNHMQAYLRTDFPTDGTAPGRSRSLGYVRIYVLDPLITVGSVTSVTCSLFSILENSEFKVPRLSSAITDLSKLAIAQAEAGLLTSAISALGSVGGGVLSPILENIGSTAKGMMSNVSKMSVHDVVEHVGKKALPSNFLGDAIDAASGLFGNIMSAMGMDNPTIPQEYGRGIVKSNGSMNYAVGPEHIEKLAVLPSALSLVTPETFGTVVDEMDVNYLYRKYCFLARFEIQGGITGNKIGDIVYSAPLSPFPTLLSEASGEALMPVGSVIQDYFRFPLISYLGLPYRWWTGGLKYKFIICSSSVHTCKLFVGANYDVFTKPKSLLDATSQYGIAIEINQGSNEFEFAVPYVAETPYKDVSRGRSNYFNSMGTLNVSILNPLVAPNSVAQSISVLVFIAGSDDFSYEYLANYNPAIPVYRPVLSQRDAAANEAKLEARYGQWSPYIMAESGVIAQQSVAPTNVDPTVTDSAIGEKENEEDIQLAPPQVELEVDDHFGITSINLRDLLKKYQFIGRFNFDNVLNGFGGNWKYTRVYAEDIFSPPLLSKNIYTTPSVNTRNPGLLSWASMFRQFKGGFRVKGIISTLNSDDAYGTDIFNTAMVYWTPGDITPLVKDSYEEITDILSMMPNNGLVQTSTQYIPLQTTPRLCVVNGVASNVLEFEVPYSSKFLSTLTYSGNAFGDSFEGQYKSLGALTFVVCGHAASTNYELVLYVSLADEARFGTLYRVPQVYVPGYFQVSGTSPNLVLTPKANYGYGQYKLPPPLDDGTNEWEKLTAESGSMTFTNNTLGSIPESDDWRKDLALVRSASVTPNRGSVRPMNPQDKGRGASWGGNGFDKWFKNQLSSALSGYTGVSADELRRIVSTITHKFDGMDLAKVLRKYGVSVDTHGVYHYNAFKVGRPRTNRRPKVSRRRPWSNQNNSWYNRSQSQQSTSRWDSSGWN